MGEETIDRKPFKKALTEMEMKSFFFFVDTRAAAHTRLSFNFFFLLLCQDRRGGKRKKETHNIQPMAAASKCMLSRSISWKPKRSSYLACLGLGLFLLAAVAVKMKKNERTTTTHPSMMLGMEGKRRKLYGREQCGNFFSSSASFLLFYFCPLADDASLDSFVLFPFFATGHRVDGRRSTITEEEACKR